MTCYEYDRKGSMMTKTDALGGRAAYGKTGNLLVQNVGDSQTIVSDYNKIGKIIKVSLIEETIVAQMQKCA